MGEREFQEDSLINLQQELQAHLARYNQINQQNPHGQIN